MKILHDVDLWLRFGIGVVFFKLRTVMRPHMNRKALSKYLCHLYEPTRPIYFKSDLALSTVNCGGKRKGLKRQILSDSFNIHDASAYVFLSLIPVSWCHFETKWTQWTSRWRHYQVWMDSRCPHKMSPKYLGSHAFPSTHVGCWRSRYW